MRIALFGYGKMGKTIERIAQDRGHAIIAMNSYPPIVIPEDISCAIEFTHADCAPSIIRACFDARVPIVSGTTGWNAQKQSINSYCLQHHGAFLWAPNFSIGMHLVFTMNKVLAGLMEPRPEYDVEIQETHHTEKKDKPSGTAIALANQILGILSRKTSWQLKEESVYTEPADAVLEITAERIASVNGIHHVTYTGPHDIISLHHKALSRDAFGLGAVISAEWLVGKTGVFTFSDVLGTGDK